MNKKRSGVLPSSLSQRLAQARELVRTQQAIHHSLVQLQERAKGVMPGAVLDQLYRAEMVSAAEYLTLKLAAGETENQAISDLRDVHGRENALPPLELMEPDLPQYSGPTRTARRPAKSGNVLRGHPLD